MSRDSTAYRDQLVQIESPPGSALSRETGSWYVRLMHALAEEFARADAFVESLADELDPTTTSELLPEWEAMAGLPDPCAGQLPTIEARRGAVVARLSARARLDKLALMEAAETYGFTIDDVIEYDAFVAGTSEVGEELADQESQFVVDIETPTAQIFEAEVGGFAVGDPLGFIGDLALACLLERVKAAHLLFRIVIGGP